MGEGLLFLDQLDTNVVALDITTGKEVWRTPIEHWQNGYVVTSAPLHYDGIVYSGIAGGEFGTRGRPTSLDGRTGKIVWRAYTLPGPGEISSNTWPNHIQVQRGGATIWNTPALDPELGLIYFATGNIIPDIVDAASPVVLFDTVINDEPRKGIAEAGRTGWVDILDRANGRPLIGSDLSSRPKSAACGISRRRHGQEPLGLSPAAQLPRRD